MQDKEFIDFISASTSRGAATYNLKTQNVSKMAQAILADTPYKKLAKAHIGANIKQGYYNNTKFKDKLEQVLQDLNITLIA